MKQLYIDITERLTDTAANNLFLSKGLPIMKFVDIYKEQYLDPSKFELYQLPAAFMQCSIAYDQDPNSNDGTATVAMHITFEQIRTTGTNTQAATKAEALKFFDFWVTTNKLLAGLESENTSKLVLTSEVPINTELIEVVYILTYTCRYTANATSSKEKWNYTDEDLETSLEGEINKTVE